MRQSDIQGERLHLLRPFLALIALSAFLGAMVLPDRAEAALSKQDAKQQDTKAKQDNKDAEKSKQEPAKPQTVSKEKFTAEQIVESVIYLYGSRPMLDQIRRYGVERGKIIRYPAEGNPDETNYERRKSGNTPSWATSDRGGSYLYRDSHHARNGARSLRRRDYLRPDNELFCRAPRHTAGFDPASDGCRRDK